LVQLRLVVMLPNSQPLNDVGARVVYEEKGDKKRLLVLAIDDKFDVEGDWGAQLRPMREKYAQALGVKNLDVKVM